MVKSEQGVKTYFYFVPGQYFKYIRPIRRENKEAGQPIGLPCFQIKNSAGTSWEENSSGDSVLA